MKKQLLMIACILGSLISNAQVKIDSIKITPLTISVNEMKIDGTVKKEDFENLFGKPSRIKKIAGKDKFLIYDEQGISIELDRETGILKGVFVNYNWDEDEKMAKSKYLGVLQIDQIFISEEIQGETIAEKTGFKDLNCDAKILCLTYPIKDNGVNIMIGYKDENSKITQIGFMFK